MLDNVIYHTNILDQYKMKKLNTLIILCTLVGCGPVMKTNYTFTPPKKPFGRLCANQCMYSKDNCLRNCHNNVIHCEQSNAIQAQLRYQQYVNMKLMRHEPIDRTVNDFTSYAGCSEFSCKNNCNENYRTCYTNCGGTITSSEECIAFCN